MLSMLRAGVFGSSLVAAVALRTVVQPITITSFTATCTPLEYHASTYNDWVFTWTITGSTGAMYWEIYAVDGATDDPITGTLIETQNDVPGGPSAQVRYSSDVYYLQGGTSYTKYFFVRYGSIYGGVYTDWYPLDLNPLDLADGTNCSEPKR
jgi:hypothetical protein